MNQSPVLGNLNVVFKLLVSRIIIFFSSLQCRRFLGLRECFARESATRVTIFTLPNLPPS